MFGFDPVQPPRQQLNQFCRLTIWFVYAVLLRHHARMSGCGACEPKSLHSAIIDVLRNGCMY